MSKKNKDMPYGNNGGGTANPLNNPKIKEQLEQITSVGNIKLLFLIGTLNGLAEKTKNGFVPFTSADDTDETVMRVVYDDRQPLETEQKDESGGRYYPVVLDMTFAEQDGKLVPEDVQTYLHDDDFFKGMSVYAFISEEESYIEINHPAVQNSLYIQEGKWIVF